MTIRTHAMRTARVDDKGQGCLVWVPFNTVAPWTDLIDGSLAITDADTNESYDVANTATFGYTTYTAAGSGFISIPAGKFILAIYGSQVVTLSAFISAVIGADGSSTRVGIAASSCNCKGDDGITESGTTISSVSSGENCFIAFGIDMSDNKVYVYESINDGASVLKGTETAGPSGPFTIARTVLFGAVGAPQHHYGYALYAFDAKPSDAVIITALDFCHDQWIQGHKVLPPGLKDLAYGG